MSRKFKRNQKDETKDAKPIEMRELKLRNDTSNSAMNNGLDAPLPSLGDETSVSKSIMISLSQPSTNISSNINNNNNNNDNNNDENERETSHDSLSSESQDSIFNEYSRRKGCIDIDYFDRILGKMPWRSIPLTNSITNSGDDFDKFQQAMNIYNKYIDRNSYYCINISSDAWDLIHGLMERLKIYKENNDINLKYNGQSDDEIKDNDDDNDNDNKEITPPPRDKRLSEQPEIAEMNAIHSVSSKGTNDVQINYLDDNDELNVMEKLKEAEDIKSTDKFYAILMSLFDSSLPDVFHNLEDSMSRFRITDQFLSLTGKK